MAKKLLVDTISFRLGITESANGGKVVAQGRFALADVPTANGRVYKRALWVRELNRLKEAMAARRVFGEADHPADGRTKLTRVAHILTNLELTEDGEVIGTAEIIDTTGGKELKAIIAAGGSIGVSSRGYGSVSSEGGNDVVEDDYQLDTFDFVVDPAQGSAYPEFSVESKTPEGKVIKENMTGTPATVVKSDEPAAPAPDATEPKDEDDETPKDDTTDPTAPATPPVADAAAKEAMDMKNQIEQAVAKAKAELRAEVTSQLLSDPKVAGARMAIESVKTILRPYILDKEVNVALEEKDLRIKALEEQVAGLTKKAGSSKVENVALSKAVKDLGFKLFVTKTLANHPQLESIIQGMGDLTLVENIEALQKLVAPHKAKAVRTEEVEGSKKLIAAKDQEILRLSESLRTTSNANKKVVLERDAALETAQRVSIRLYLEKKLAGNPKSSTIRMKFKEMKEKTKDSVDALIEAFASAPTRRGSDFSSVRRSLAARRAPSSTLVEDSISETGSQSENGERMHVAEGLDMDIAQVNRLAGIR